MTRFRKLWLGVVMGVMMGVGALGVMGGEVWAVTCPEGTLRPNETVASAVECNVPANETYEEGGETKEKDVFYYVNQIINVVLGMMGIIAVIVIILSGIQIATAGGDPNKVGRGKMAIMWAVVGLVISLLAFAIVNFVLRNVFG